MRHLDYVVAFDTPSDRRRRKLTRLLSRYGVRVQRSVFRVSGSAADIQQLWTALERLCLPEEDQVLMSQTAPGSWRQFGDMNDLSAPILVVL